MYNKIINIIIIINICRFINMEKANNDYSLLSEYDIFLNYGTKKIGKTNFENAIFKSKIEVLGSIFKKNINGIKYRNEKVDLIFLIDASSSVGEANFVSEIKFVKKLLSDFTVSYDTTRVAVVTFSSQNNVVKNVDQITNPNRKNNKCLLLKKQLNEIKFTGGSTYTLGAFKIAQDIILQGRNESKKVVFLITDGFSNGGDPVPIAKQLHKKQVTIFTIGIRNGNFQELYEISTQPGQYYSYLLDSYEEFENLARTALHSVSVGSMCNTCLLKIPERNLITIVTIHSTMVTALVPSQSYVDDVDLQDGDYIPAEHSFMCRDLCLNPRSGSCCDSKATCTCGTDSGQYSCTCRLGYYGSGLENSCTICPNGTYADGYNLCRPCPDYNHITVGHPALDVSYCKCKRGFRPIGQNKCQEITCPKLKPPENGYFSNLPTCRNTLLSACGVRCKVGYKLSGDDVRLCQADGTWSGIEATCQVKTCPLLKQPTNGRVQCFDEDDNPITGWDNMPGLPIDSKCKFRCNFGFSLTGSKVRNCLPLSKWDGLNVVCKPIKCPKLIPIENGSYEPPTCTSTQQSFGQTCTVMCAPGFKVKGPVSTFCAGRHGQWSQKSTSACEDVSPPDLKCPKDITVAAFPGKYYAHVDWEEPLVTDNNANSNITVWTKPAIKNKDNFKFKIGKTTVTYTAIDSSKNKAKCSFSIQVLDIEPPTIEYCIDPPIFLLNDNYGANITWDEPNIIDNSQKNVTVIQSHQYGYFPIGETIVHYIATDNSNNTSECFMNITVQESKCHSLSDPLFGKTICTDHENGVHCVATCLEGYAFAIEPEIDKTSENNNSDESSEIVCNNEDPVWFDEENTEFPDCSVTEIPNSLSQNGIVNLETDTDICNNSNVLSELQNEFKNDLTNHIDDICKNEMICNLENIDLLCGDQEVSSKEELTNKITRKKRNIVKENSHTGKNKKKHRINIKFEVKGKLNKKKSKNRYKSNSFDGVNIFNPNFTTTVFRKHRNMTFRVDFHLQEVKIICENGSIVKRRKCVKCPRGTFHNVSTNSCQSCSFGFYNDKMGQLTCQKCPENYSTNRIHSKSFDECRAKCPPGSHAKKKTIRYSKKHRHLDKNIINRISLMPHCVSCPLNEYQSEYDQISCVKCPAGRVTLGYGSKNIADCVPDPYPNCENNNLCAEGGKCVMTSDIYYSCECDNDYLGTNCDTRYNPCFSMPCLNGGLCIENLYEVLLPSYICICRSGFLGSNCETSDDRCVERLCLNNATCVRNIDGAETCICKGKFEGEFCQTETKHCRPNTCDNGGECTETETGFKCLCNNGYVGRRCDVLPCDYLPCQTNEICVNLNETNATKDSYRCECPAGYKGYNCSEKLDFCNRQPCLNGGLCISNLTSYICNCTVPYVGSHCEHILDTKFILNFPKSGTTDYVKIDGPSKDLSQLSLCFWIETEDEFNYGTIFSYANTKFDNAFTLTDYNGLVLYINGEYKVTDLYLNDGLWHFVCLTWNSTDGQYRIYKNGKLSVEGTGLSNTTTIEGNGQLILGQEQDTLGGKFSQSESFIGKLTNLDIWDRILSPSEILNYLKTCNNYYGNLYYWGQFKEHIYGDIQIEPWKFCKKCGKPANVYNGIIELKDNVASYRCKKGFIIRYNNTNHKIFKRKCTKSTNWEGTEEPICVLVSCEFPGYIKNGYITGNSYYFGNTVIYHCERNYELVGMKVRVCTDAGTWSYRAPICLGIQCPKIRQPENSNISVLFEHSLDDDLKLTKTSFESGTQIEFNCANGTALVGENIITCQENGLWDNEPPKCEKLIKETETTTTAISTFALTTEPKNMTNQTTKAVEIMKYSTEEETIETSTTALTTISSVIESPKKVTEKSENQTTVEIASTTELLKTTLPLNLNKSVESSTTSTEKITTVTTEKSTRVSSTEKIATTTRVVIFNVPSEIINNTVLKPTKALNNSKKTDAKNATEVKPTITTGLKSIKESKNQSLSTINQTADASKSNQTKIENTTNVSETKKSTEKNILKPNTTVKNTELKSVNESKNQSLSTKNQTADASESNQTKIENTTNVSETEKNMLKPNTTVKNTVEKQDELTEVITEKTIKGGPCFSADLPVVPPNGYYLSDLTSTVYKTGEVITFKCRHGYEPALQDYTECLDYGKWSNTEISCTPIKCGPPSNIQNMRPVRSLEMINQNVTYYYGNMIKYVCVDGYETFGNPTARCMANGKWSAIKRRSCIRISCLKPRLNPNAIIIGDSYLYEDKLTIKCPEGSSIDSFVIQCHSNKTWLPQRNCN